MELLILLAIFLFTAVAALLGWTPDTRDGRDWQPRGGWKPNKAIRHPKTS
jgi:hypothetical protein